MATSRRRLTPETPFMLRWRSPIEAQHAGLYIAAQDCQHPTRTLDSYELFFVRSGTLELGEEDAIFRVKAGQTLLLWANREHFGKQKYARDLSFYWIHFRVPSRVRVPSQARKSGANNWVELPVPRIATPARPTRLAELWGQYLSDQHNGDLQSPGAELLILQMLFEAGIELSSAQSPVAARLLAGRAEAFIASHLQENLSASQVANALQVSTDYLNRAFRATRGVTTTEWIQQRRIEEARSLLREGAWNISQVAKHCGFPSAAYFSRLFKKETGLNPLEFRKIYASTYINRH